MLWNEAQRRDTARSFSSKLSVTWQPHHLTVMETSNWGHKHHQTVYWGHKSTRLLFATRVTATCRPFERMHVKGPCTLAPHSCSRHAVLLIPEWSGIIKWSIPWQSKDSCCFSGQWSVSSAQTLGYYLHFLSPFDWTTFHTAPKRCGFWWFFPKINAISKFHKVLQFFHDCTNRFIYLHLLKDSYFSRDYSGYTYTECPTSSVGAGYQAAFCGRQRNIKLFLVQQERASNSYWHRHVANDILAAGTHHLECKDNTN